MTVYRVRLRSSWGFCRGTSPERVDIRCELIKTEAAREPRLVKFIVTYNRSELAQFVSYGVVYTTVQKHTLPISNGGERWRAWSYLSFYRQLNTRTVL